MSITVGKILISAVAIATSTGVYVADWNETHIHNPRWPPHARFHNGQTMTTGLALGLLTLYHLWIRSCPTTQSALQGLNYSLLFIVLYYVPALSGALYPGAKFVDPEFGEGHPQFYLFNGFLGIAWVGWWIERRRVLESAQEVKTA